MSLYLRALSKPYYRRYHAEMLQQRVEILGPPRRLLNLVRRTAVAAALLPMPDLTRLRTLVRASTAYGDLLIQEGHAADAEPYLGSWETLTALLNQDSFTLIDVLLNAALARHGAEVVAPLYRRLGREADAERTEWRSARISAPVDTWREQRQTSAGDSGDERILRERGGVLARVLMPALGTWPEPSAYDAGRRLEYTVTTESVVGLVTLAFLLGMLGCLIVALRWHFFAEGSTSIPLLLVPGWKETGKIVLVGVLGPVAL